MAQASSLSEVSPEMPTAPMMSPAGVLISTPPGLVTMRPSLAAASMVKNCGVLAARAPSLAEGDIETQQARLVLALERDQMPADVEHGDGQRRATGVAALLECGVDDGRGLRERDGHRDSEVDE